MFAAHLESAKCIVWYLSGSIVDVLLEALGMLNLTEILWYVSSKHAHVLLSALLTMDSMKMLCQVRGYFDGLDT